MTYSARTIYFLHQQMANGHRLPDPWDEACALQKAMTRTTHLFDCLWQSEGDPKRFENIREWASILHADAKTKLTAIELFVKLEHRKRQRRSNGSSTPQSKSCNPTLATPRTHTEYTSTPGETDVSKYQARPDLGMADKASAIYELEAVCDTDTKSDTHWQTHAMQTIGQDGRLLNTPKPNLARRAKEFIKTRTPPLTDQRDQSSRHAEKQARYRTNPSTTPIPHRANPEAYYTKTQAQSPRKYVFPHGSTHHIRPELSYTSPEINTKRRHSYQDQMETSPNDNDEQRYPRLRRTIDGEDGRQERNRDEERRFPDTRNVHRKRKAAATEETIAW